jgi:hypothetical protein
MLEFLLESFFAILEARALEVTMAAPRRNKKGAIFASISLTARAARGKRLVSRIRRSHYSWHAPYELLIR